MENWEILILCSFILIILLATVIVTYFIVDEDFTGNSNDYTVKKITLSDGSIKYQPWGKTNKNKWTSIKISNPWLDELPMDNIFNTYEEAKEICNRCCAQNATVTSIE